MIVKFIPRKFETIKNYLTNLPRGTKIVAMRALTEYLVGDEGHGLKHEPANKFVSRKSAYGQVSDAPAGYFSWKQFRYVAWLTEGFTKRYTRTHELANAWQIKPEGSDWTKVRIVNEADGAAWVFGDNTQARQPAKVGWRRMSDTISANLAGAMRSARAAVAAFLKSKG